jgi:hypothetical protein
MTPQACSLYEKVRRGDVSECSFAFTVTKEGQRWSQRQKPGTDGTKMEHYYAVRTLTDVNLLDVSPVTEPAYPDTRVGARKYFESEAEVRSMLAVAKAAGLPTENPAVILAAQRQYLDALGRKIAGDTDREHRQRLVALANQILAQDRAAQEDAELRERMKKLSGRLG